MTAPKKDRLGWLSTDEADWLTFYEAAVEIAQQFRVSRAEAEARLRQACADQKLHSMKAPVDDGNTLPFEFWTRIAPSEWRGREVDYDGPDADGSKTEVMINEADYRYWLTPEQGQQPTRKAGRQILIVEYLKEMFPVEKFPHGVPDYYHRKRLKDELMARDKTGTLKSVHDDTIRSAIKRHKASIPN